MFERYLLERLLRAAGEPPVRLALEGGPEVLPSGAIPVATVRFRDRRTVISLLLDPETGFGDGYSEGRIEVDGDLGAAIESVYRATGDRHGPYTRLLSFLLERVQDNTLRGSRKNIHRHYDLKTDFYRLWLDRQLVYTCAYFPTPSATLEEAQMAKMDHVCRKLQLRAGETVVEAGCGWGALALHMARQYGAAVKAFNISHEQVQYARRRAQEEGLSGHVEFIEDDYRNISGRFDVFVSVGMLEHVGTSHYAELGRLIHRSVGESGRGLLHFIGRSKEGPVSTWTRKRIFPGTYTPTLRQAIRFLEPWDYGVLDVENLRLHYAKTLEHWRERYERSVPMVEQMFDARFARTWRLYLTGAWAGFQAGTQQLFQVLFAGPQCQRIPWTRAYLYDEEEWIAATS